jgi:hypothetical protein
MELAAYNISNILIKELNSVYIFHISSLEIFEQTLLLRNLCIRHKLKNAIKFPSSNKE